MELSVIVTLMGGLGLFLLGMHQMGDGMEKAAGARMRNILEAVTSNRSWERWSEFCSAR